MAPFGKAAVHVAARHADRMVASLVTPASAGRLVAELGVAAQIAGRRRPKAAVWVPVAVTSEPAAAVAQVRRMLAGYFVSDLVLGGVLIRYPGIQWIFTHGGGALPLLADRIEMFRTLLGGGDPDADTVQQQVGRLWFDMAGTPFPRQVPTRIEAVGSERILYGSDYCWTPAAAALAQIASVDAAELPGNDTWRALTTRNAYRLLPGLLGGL